MNRQRQPLLFGVIPGRVEMQMSLVRCMSHHMTMAWGLPVAVIVRGTLR